MTATPAGLLRRHLREPQHRNAYLLMANTLLAAAAGLVFWLVLTRLLRLPAGQVGLGYATIAVGTLLGVLAKGGLDAALLRTVPWASRPAAGRLLGLALAIGASAALLLGLALALAARSGHALADLSGWAWASATAIGLLLVVTWLLDSFFLAERDVRVTLVRTLAASAVRILLPFLLVAVAAPSPIAMAWAAALAASAIVGLLVVRRLPDRDGEAVPAPSFLASAYRNMASSAAEFLPGLLLAPLVLALHGPDAAAYFGIAWTVATLLFLAAAAVGRSALAEMARPEADLSAAVRRGALQVLVVVGPGAVLGALLAPFVLGVFGPAYAAEGALPFVILCASAVVVAPSSLYLAVLRVRERTLPMAVLPVATIALLLALAPLLGATWGLPGVALAWGLANVPFGVWSIVRLVAEARGASPPLGLHSPLTPSLPVQEDA